MRIQRTRRKGAFIYSILAKGKSWLNSCQRGDSLFVSGVRETIGEVFLQIEHPSRLSMQTASRGYTLENITENVHASHTIYDSFERYAATEWGYTFVVTHSTADYCPLACTRRALAPLVSLRGLPLVQKAYMCEPFLHRGSAVLRFLLKKKKINSRQGEIF